MNRVALLSIGGFLVAFGGFVTGVVAAPLVYEDVPPAHWAALSIRWVSERGIMTGPADQPGYFDPAGLVNRAQLATALTRMHQDMMEKIDDMELQLAELEYERSLVEELLEK